MFVAHWSVDDPVVDAGYFTCFGKLLERYGAVPQRQVFRNGCAEQHDFLVNEGDPFGEILGIDCIDWNAA